METLSDDLLAEVRRKLAGDGTGSNEYYAERRQGIREGKPTWEVRNFDAYQGRIYDFYAAGKWLGMVEETWGSPQGCRAYKNDEGYTEYPPKGIPIVEEDVTLPAAVAMVESLLPENAN